VNASKAALAMRIDIVIDNHNYAGFLPAAIDSALAQTYEHVRVIVVDDGSTDESRQVIASYGERIAAVLKQNGGQASAFNAGFAAGDSDVVMFLDADDTLEPQAAERVVAAFAANPDAAKVQWRLELALADGTRTGIVRPAPHVPLPQGDMRRAELAFPFDIAWMATSGNAFPRAVLGQIMPMPEADYRINADFYLQHLSALLGPVVSLETVGGLRRMHGTNAYEREGADALDLAQVRETIRAAAVTREQIEQLATRLELDRPYGQLLSVSDLGNRLISLRLEPTAHPLTQDRRGRLVLSGIRAARHRFDVRPPLRVAFCAWFLLAAVMPRATARRLGQVLLMPERRGRVNRLLRPLHRSW
jgi:hypothetical protein